ncbi:hypothetical protein [Sphaerimonospora thailandensis]|nr:hypothetical protein [Sphaerimonospora thailandensis]
MRGPHGARDDGMAPARHCEADHRCRGEGARDGVRLPDARRYEALGRVLAALAGEAEVREACRDLTWRRGADHCWHVEWRDGPHAAEVAALLVDRIRGPEAAVPLAGLSGPATASTASLDVTGASFVLLAVDPVGMDRLRARPGRWRLSATLAGVTADRAGGEARRAGSRRCWEELLGG